MGMSGKQEYSIEIMGIVVLIVQVAKSQNNNKGEKWQKINLTNVNCVATIFLMKK